MPLCLTLYGIMTLKNRGAFYRERGLLMSKWWPSSEYTILIEISMSGLGQDSRNLSGIGYCAVQYLCLKKNVRSGHEFEG